MIGISLANINSGQRINYLETTLASPVDTTVTIAVSERVKSSGDFVIDSVAAGTGIMVITGIWRLT